MKEGGLSGRSLERLVRAAASPQLVGGDDQPLSLEIHTTTHDLPGKPWARLMTANRGLANCDASVVAL